MDVNHVILIGRCTRDSALTYTSGGMAVCKFAIAVNRRKKNGDQWVDEVSFFDIACFGKTAESLNQYLQKGKQVAVDGSLHQDRWEQDGQNRSRVVINADNIQLLGGNEQRGEQRQSAPADQGHHGSSAQQDFQSDIPF